MAVLMTSCSTATLVAKKYTADLALIALRGLLALLQEMVYEQWWH